MDTKAATRSRSRNSRGNAELQRNPIHTEQIYAQDQKRKKKALSSRWQQKAAKACRPFSFYFTSPTERPLLMRRRRGKEWNGRLSRKKRQRCGMHVYGRAIPELRWGVSGVDGLRLSKSQEISHKEIDGQN